MARTAPAPNIPAIPGMNPGIFVLAGGGSGGGGGGKGAGGQGGAQGAEGSGGGDPAAGGGAGAGNCGTGSPGGCTNCSDNLAAGDPVDIASGTVYTHPSQDLWLPGAFDLSLQRAYSSANREVDVGMGWGWHHSFGWTLEERRRVIIVRTGDGRRVELPRLSRPGAEARKGPWGVMRLAEGYAVRPGNEFVHLFAPAEPGSRKYRLTRVLYRNRGSISLQYERGRLARAIDSVGRIVLVSSNQQGRIASVTVSSDSGHAITFAHYRYDDHGRLIAVTDADGYTTTYTYDDEHRLVRYELPTGLAFQFRYDRQGRCVETWGAPRSGQREPALAPGLDETLADGRTAAKGVYHWVINHYDDYHETVNALGTQRVVDGPGGKTGVAVNALGGVTSRSFDENDRVASRTNAAGGTTTYEYDSLDKVVREIDPEGYVFQASFDGGGRAVEFIDPEGGRSTLERDGSGEVVAITDQTGAVTTYDRDARGLMVGARDPEGGERRLEYDAHANLVAFTTASGGTFRYTYDHWGRCTSETDPRGQVHQFGYSLAGRLVSITDPLGRTTQRGYDGLGNLVRITQPDGTSTVAEYGGYGWLTAVRHADGSEIRLAYNREGLPVSLDDESGRTYRFAWGPSGRLRAETDYAGRTTRYGHDPMGWTIWKEDTGGRTTIERDANGQIVKMETPEGSVRELEYDGRGQMVAATADDCVTTFVRDATGRIVRETQELDGVTHAVSSRRDRNGRRAGFDTSLGLDVEMRRDAAGLLSELSVGGEAMLSLERDAFGLPVRETLRRDGVVTKGYDAVARLRRRALHRPGTAPAEGEPERLDFGSDAALEQLFDYTPVDEVEKVTASDGRDVEMEYDVRRHLTRRVTADESERFSADPTHAYERDEPDAPARQYGPAGEVVREGDHSFRYDDKGRLIRKEHRVDGELQVTRFHWDDWGMLRAVDNPDGSRIELAYDAFARRIRKRVIAGSETRAHRYVWDLVTMVHDEPVEGDVESYLYEDHDALVPIAQRRSGDDWLHILPDVSGVPEALVDGRGSIVARYAHRAFGELRVLEGDRQTPFRFVGQQADDDVGLHYNRYRYYDPSTGRYVSADPIGLKGGLHLYEYGPNPVGWVDPFGWQHGMYAVGMPHGDAQHGEPAGSVAGHDVSWYESGAGQDATCPPELGYTGARSRLAHTEQKFCYDLLASGKRGGSYSLAGERPPCPNCHGAMLRTSQEADAEMTYSWGNNSMTYKGGSVVDHSGPGADFLMKGDTDHDGPFGGRYGPDNFELTDDPALRTGSNLMATDPKEYWGFEQTGAGGDYLAVNP